MTYTSLDHPLTDAAKEGQGSRDPREAKPFSSVGCHTANRDFSMKSIRVRSPVAFLLHLPSLPSVTIMNAMTSATRGRKALFSSHFQISPSLRKVGAGTQEGTDAETTEEHCLRALSLALLISLPTQARQLGTPREDGRGRAAGPRKASSHEGRLTGHS